MSNWLESAQKLLFSCIYLGSKSVKISVHLCHMSNGCRGEHIRLGYKNEFWQVTTNLIILKVYEWHEIKSRNKHLLQSKKEEKGILLYKMWQRLKRNICDIKWKLLYTFVSVYVQEFIQLKSFVCMGDVSFYWGFRSI